MRPEQVEKLIEGLEQVRLRPTMYYVHRTAEATERFLNGFEAACSALGLKPPELQLWVAAARSRGWDFQATGSVSSMRARGLSEAEIADELLVVEIELLKRLADQDI